MRTSTLMITVAALIITFAVGSAPAQELQWLSYRTAAQADRIVGGMLMDWIDLSTEAPQGVDLPKFEGKQQYFGMWKSPMVENASLTPSSTMFF